MKTTTDSPVHPRVVTMSQHSLLNAAAYAAVLSAPFVENDAEQNRLTIDPTMKSIIWQMVSAVSEWPKVDTPLLRTDAMYSTDGSRVEITIVLPLFNNEGIQIEYYGGKLDVTVIRADIESESSSDPEERIIDQLNKVIQSINAIQNGKSNLTSQPNQHR